MTFPLTSSPPTLSPPTPSPPTPSSPLLLLPRELRNRIYHFLLHPAFTTELHRPRTQPTSNFRPSTLYFDVSTPSPPYTAPAPAPPPTPNTHHLRLKHPRLPPSPPFYPTLRAQTIAHLLSTSPFAPTLGVCAQITAEVVEELSSWLGERCSTHPGDPSTMRVRTPPLTLHACGVASEVGGCGFVGNMRVVEHVLRDLLPGVRVVVVEVGGGEEDGVERVCGLVRRWVGEEELVDDVESLSGGGDGDEVVRVSVYEGYLRPRDGGKARHLYGRLGVFSRRG